MPLLKRRMQHAISLTPGRVLRAFALPIAVAAPWPVPMSSTPTKTRHSRLVGHPPSAQKQNSRGALYIALFPAVSL